VTRESALANYFAEAVSWDADRTAQQARSLRLVGLVAAAGWLAAIVIALALMLLMPLKRVEPFVIRVDSSTGLVDIVPVFKGAASMPEAVTRFFLDHYVTVCERFNFATAESDYQECGAFHTAALNQAWYQKWAKTSPASPLNVYRDGSTVRAQVSAVSFFTRASGVADLAQVRYIKALRAAGGSDDQVTHWIATVQYVYAEPSKDPKTRLWNPLGFKIIDFRTEPEVLAESVPIGSQATAANSASRHAP
jgi:type IV secretion system protein VirB8